jgi:hypothetical protein
MVRVGDDQLDWDGPQAGQGTVPGENDEEYDVSSVKVIVILLTLVILSYVYEQLDVLCSCTVGCLMFIAVGFGILSQIRISGSMGFAEFRISSFVRAKN